MLLNIPFRFTGLQSLKIKETDRIEALKTELCKLGYLLIDSNDSILEWNGERDLYDFYYERFIDESEDQLLGSP